MFMPQDAASRYTPREKSGLKRAGAYLDYTEADLERDIGAIRGLGR